MFVSTLNPLNIIQIMTCFVSLWSSVIFIWRWDDILTFHPGYLPWVLLSTQFCGARSLYAKRFVKGTNGRQKTYEIFHVYCIFYSGFMCQTTVIFGITKDGSLVLNTLASWNCFTCRNLFQNGANDMSECLTFKTAFCKKAQNFV